MTAITTTAYQVYPFPQIRADPIEALADVAGSGSRNDAAEQMPGDQPEDRAEESDHPLRDRSNQDAAAGGSQRARMAISRFWRQRNCKC